MRKLILSLTGMALFALLASGCNSRGGGGTGPGTGGPFKIHGIFVRDANLTNDKDKAAFELTRNDTLFNLAALTIDTFKVDTTLFTTYYRQSPPDYLRPGQNHTIHLVYSSNTLDLTTSLFMPDSFRISNIIPANRLSTGGNGVQVEWTASGNSTGYIVAIVHDSAALSSIIDTSFFPDFATSTPVSPSAFQDANNQLRTGLYRIYLIAFRGGLLSFSGQPFPLPPNYSVADTNYSLTVSGRIVSAFVADYDTIRVVTGP
ncbi:MAG: hypothetical protein ACRECJ_03320 [Limisphaerales bacterium]